ncbi:MAG: FtsX-like permease family protein [Acidimicrobiales bacterium]
MIHSLYRAVAYGAMAAWRRRRLLTLPVITVATGAFLVVLVVALMPAVRRQGEALGSGDSVGRATLAIAVVVLLVGAFEVAIAATRSINQRSAEIGVLSTFGVPPRCTLGALLVEPVATAAAGAVIGAIVGGLFGLGAPAVGMIDDSVQAGDVVVGIILAVGVSVVAAIAASAVPTVRAVRRPPLASLSSS